MQRHEIESVFDKCAAGYDQRLSTLAPFQEALYLLITAVLAEAPEDARVLCVGAGTGAEVIELARRRAGWRFTVVEPAAAMLEMCRRNVEAAGLLSRCEFHGGYLDTLPAAEPFDAATALLVSQFLLDRAERVTFFRGIGERLRPGGWMIHSELAGDTSSAEYQNLLDVWWRLTRPANAPADGLEKLRAAYQNDVAVLPPDEVAATVMAGGFETPVQFLQTGLIHAWFARPVAHSAAREAR